MVMGWSMGDVGADEGEGCVRVGGGGCGAVAGPFGLAPEPEVVLGRRSARSAHHKLAHEVIGAKCVVASAFPMLCSTQWYACSSFL